MITNKSSNQSIEENLALQAQLQQELAEEQAGFPGDGSGEDDLADLMAHGDEGCYDAPEDEGLDAAYGDLSYVE